MALQGTRRRRLMFRWGDESERSIQGLSRDRSPDLASMIPHKMFRI
jgi:hypothetical protein